MDSGVMDYPGDGDLCLRQVGEDRHPVLMTDGETDGAATRRNGGSEKLILNFGGKVVDSFGGGR